jgi:hypothetical protein
MFNDGKESQLSRPLADQVDEDDTESIRSLPIRRRWCFGWWRTLCYALFWIVSVLVASQIGALLAVASIDYDHECAAHTTQYCMTPRLVTILSGSVIDSKQLPC